MAIRTVPSIFSTNVRGGGATAVKLRVERYLLGTNDMMEKVCEDCKLAREADKDSSSFKVKRWQFGYPQQGEPRVHYPNCCRAKKKNKKPPKLNPRVKPRTFVMVDEEGPAKRTRSEVKRRRSIGPGDHLSGSAKKVLAPRGLF